MMRGRTTGRIRGRKTGSRIVRMRGRIGQRQVLRRRPNSGLNCADCTIQHKIDKLPCPPSHYMMEYKLCHNLFTFVAV